MDFNPIAKKDYFRKLECLFNVVGKASEDELAALDPYKLADTAWVDNIAKWPPVSYPDIYSYLVETPGEYSREKLKAFKSLEAYNYYTRYWYW